jgi:hypothetical protein
MQRAPFLLRSLGQYITTTLAAFAHTHNQDTMSAHDDIGRGQGPRTYRKRRAECADMESFSDLPAKRPRILSEKGRAYVESKRKGGAGVKRR